MSDTSGPLRFVSQDMTQSSAVRLITNFLISKETDKFSNLSLGGTFPLRDFELKSSYLAKQFWICYNENAPIQEKFFLAMEDSSRSWKRDIKVEDVPITPENTSLLRPKSTFTFDSTFPKTEDGVKEFITKFTDPNLNLIPILNKEIRKYAWSFASQFGENASGLCEYPLAYFENYDPVEKVCHIDNFLEQCADSSGNDIRYVRYFFGLDESKKYIPNRIRIILFPVDTNGLVILHTKKNQLVETLMLQHSWPPPPPIN
jgi:hypothetical protein